MLPMGEIAIDYLTSYEQEARPLLIKNGQCDSYGQYLRIFGQHSEYL